MEVKKIMLKVIRAQVKDAEQIAKCARAAYCDEIKKYYNDELENEYPSKEYVEDDITKFTYYKIILNEKIIGGVYLVFVGDTKVCIEDFCIEPIYQNKGYGTQVLTELERMNQHIKVWTLVTPTYSIVNQHLYKKLGYEQVGLGEEDGIEVVKLKKVIYADGEEVNG